VVALFLARVAVQMGVTQIFWGEFADTEAIRARYVVCGRWCKFVPDCSTISVPALANFSQHIFDVEGEFSIGPQQLLIGSRR
jgi:hypothetical protein